MEAGATRVTPPPPRSPRSTWRASVPSRGGITDVGAEIFKTFKVLDNRSYVTFKPTGSDLT